MSTSSNTTRLIIEGAIRLIKGNAYRPSNSDLGAGLIGLNDLIASWSVDDILVPVVITENFTLTTGQGSYTIGPGGDFNTVRPTKIQRGIYIRDSADVDYPMRVITRELYNNLAIKDADGRPTRLYYKPSYPLGTIFFNFVPTLAETIYFDSLKPLTEITNISATLVLPPEYKKALRFNLAIELAPEFADIKIPELVIRNAEESKDALERVNSISLEEVKFDGILLPFRDLYDDTYVIR